MQFLFLKYLEFKTIVKKVLNKFVFFVVNLRIEIGF